MFSIQGDGTKIHEHTLSQLLPNILPSWSWTFKETFCPLFYTYKQGSRWCNFSLFQNNNNFVKMLKNNGCEIESQNIATKNCTTPTNHGVLLIRTSLADQSCRSFLKNGILPPPIRMSHFEPSFSIRAKHQICDVCLFCWRDAPKPSSTQILRLAFHHTHRQSHQQALRERRCHVISLIALLLLNGFFGGQCVLFLSLGFLQLAFVELAHFGNVGLVRHGER